jgi:hypothetical protein
MRDIGTLTQRVAALENSHPSITDSQQGKSLDRDEVQLMIQQVVLAIMHRRICLLNYFSGFERLHHQANSLPKSQWHE